MTEPRSYRNFIDGEWVPAPGDPFENRSPADRSEVVGRFQNSGPDQVGAAVEAAARAYQSWRKVPAPKRAEYLFRMGEILARRKEEMARDMAREMGKPLREARGDVQEAIDVCYYIAGEGRRLAGWTTPSELPSKACFTTRQPIGVAALITPWNFPMAIPSWKMIPALLCGNTVVLKPASDAPLSATNLVQVAQAAGIPRGVVGLVTGGGASVGQPLRDHPGVALVSFTGSSETGRDVATACAASFKRVSLEMGGKNAMIVMDDARLDLAIDGAVWGAFATAGQRCTATSRLIVHKQVLDPFLKGFLERTAALKVGDPLDESNDMGPVINESQMEKILEFIRIGRDEGADLAAGGVRLTRHEHGRGWYVAPTVFTRVERGMRIAREEIFGPVVSVLAADSFDEALALANDSVYGLSSSIYTQDVNRAFAAARDLETGITYVNSSTIGAETHLPFGGTKHTGNGHREGAAETALEIFTEWKTIYVDYSGRLQKAQIDNH